MRTTRAALATLTILLAVILTGSRSEGATVKILASAKAGTISGADADDDLNAFYAGLGATSSLLSGTLSAADLAGVDFFVVMLPDDAFTGPELAALGDFVANGGTLLFMGEQQGFSATENGHLNAALTALGSAMQIGTGSFDSGFHDTASGQIIAQPGITDGVALVNYGNVNSLSGVASSREIFRTASLGQVWGGYEVSGNGRIVLLADVNVISNLEDTIGNDNHVLFANLVDIQTQNAAVKILTSTLAGTIASADADNDLNAFYQAAGISSSLWPGEVSDEALMGAELLVVMLPDDAFTASELTAMSGFLAGGGRILFMGEQHGFAAAENGHIDAALAAVGSAMSLGTSSIDTSGLQDTVAGQILSHPFNTGVALLSYGNVNQVVGVPAGGGLEGELFLATDLSTAWGGVEELPGGGEVILLADVNLLSHIEDEVGNDNHVFFLNVAPQPAPSIPGLGSRGMLVLASLLLCVGASAARFGGVRRAGSS